MMYKHLLFPILTVFTLVGLGFPFVRAYEPATTPIMPFELPEEFHEHALKLSQENCAIDLDIRTTPLTPEAQTALDSCAAREVQAFRGDLETIRQALVRKIMEVGAKRTPKTFPDLMGSSEGNNFFLSLTQEDARVLYHDLVNCYFTIATETTVNFYLNKAMGVADTDAPSDTKMTKRENYELPELPKHYCYAVYDNDPLLAETYENRMTTFQQTLLSSVRESQNKETDMGFTSIIANYALEDLERYFLFLDILREYPTGSHLIQDPNERSTFRNFLYSSENSTVTGVRTAISTSEAGIVSQYDAAEHNLKAALRAYQSFERTFPIHLQYKKIQDVSKRLAKRVQHLRLAWKFLNVKFTNASIEGGAN